MLHALLCCGLYLFLVFVYLIVTVFSSHILDTNTSSCVASSALYTLAQCGWVCSCLRRLDSVEKILSLDRGISPKRKIRGEFWVPIPIIKAALINLILLLLVVI